MHVHSLCTSARLTLAILAAAASCFGCSIAYPTIQVGLSFRVKVEDNGRPARGIRLKLIGDKGHAHRISATTDQSGIALFYEVRPGSYYVQEENDIGPPDVAYLEVSARGPVDVTVSLKWPNITPVSVRSLKGAIYGPDYSTGKSQPRLSLDILDFRSRRKLGTIETGENGKFSEDISPGTYTLRLKPSDLIGWSGEQITGDIVVAVDRNAPTEGLDLALSWTSCGLGYTNLNRCPRGDFHLSRLSGQVVDPSGVALPRAKILLLDTTGTPVEQLTGDSEGKFASGRSLAGDYVLWVSYSGFTPLRTQLHAELQHEHPALLGLTVQLGIFGACSTASLQ